MKTTLYYLKLATCILIVMQVISIMSLQAQDYLITFAGEGGSSTVNTVNVENLTQGKSVTINGTDILHLKAVVTDIENTLSDEAGKVIFYPNPMKDFAKMKFTLPMTGETIISMYDVAGRKIIQKQDLLERGQHTYRIEGVGQGLYTVIVSSGRYKLSGTLLCPQSRKNVTRIEYEDASFIKEEENGIKGTTAEIEMQYNAGDRLKLTAVSGSKSTVITDVPTSSKTIDFSFVSCTDKDGNNYPVVKIATQLWMAENLKTTRYSDGTEIPLVTDNTEWIKLTTPGYCWYKNDDATYKSTYGAMYNWHAVNSGKICPAGWHVSTDAEWTILKHYLGGESVAGGKLKETGFLHWTTPNTGATNETGFTALPGGFRGDGGTFNGLKNIGYWWSPTSGGTSNAWSNSMYWSGSDVFTMYSDIYGFSVRCVID